MPKRGTVKWADLIEVTLKEIGGESHLSQIYERLFNRPEAKEKIALAKSSTNKTTIDMKSEVRCLIQRDSRFMKGETRGRWRLKHTDEPKSLPTVKERYSMPARYHERSVQMMRIMRDNPIKTDFGWAQRELAKELEIDVNSVNKLVNFMIVEELLYLKSGSGKTYDPYRYAPRDGVIERFV